MQIIVLDALHRSLGAKMGEFAGFDMPIQYPDGLKAEHLHTRSAAGLFDVTHMGQLHITAKDGKVQSLHRALEAALPIDFEGWPVGLQKYSYLLNERGGIEDDLMLTHCGDHVKMVVNAGNRAHDLALLQRLAPTLNFVWIEAALLALQGPAAEAVLCELDPQAAHLSFMQTATLRLLGADCFTSRSGYTGEDGYEISIPLSHAVEIAQRLLRHTSVKPIGLGARDTLRLEAGLPLHGNDISPATTPIEAGLAFAIPKSRRVGGAKAGGYPGANRLDAMWAGTEALTRKLVGLISNDSIPIRAHSLIEQVSNGVVVGEVCSGTVSPTLGKPVMMAYVDVSVLPAKTAPASLQTLQAAVRDKRPTVEIAGLPFVPKRYKRSSIS
jgi:aminomethyltransferase